MLEMRVDSFVNRLVKQFLLDSGGREDEALYFNFNARLSYYCEDSEEAFVESRGIHLLYHVLPQSSVVTVFSAVTPNCFAKIGDVTEWKHEVTHDSCWRECKAISETYFEMARGINQQMTWDGRETVAPIKMSQHVSFPLFGPAFRWVKVAVDKPLGEYKRTVHLLQEEV